MIILFTKLNGEHVDTTDKNVLIEAAKNGEIGPDTVVTVDGMGIEAARIKGLVFGAPAPAPEPPKPAAPAPKPAPGPKPAGKENADPLPKSVRAAFDWLTNAGVMLWWFAAFIWVLVGGGFLSNDVIGAAIAAFVASAGCIYNAFFLSSVLKILEHIAVNVTKK